MNFKIEPNIAAVNGKAEGSMTFLTADGRPLHCESGNWLSDVTRGRCRKAVAEKLHPRPRQKPGEEQEAYAARMDKWQRRRDRTASDIEKALLAAVDKARVSAERQAAEPPPAPPPPRRKDTPYVETPEGILQSTSTPDRQELKPLTNFTARIVADVTRDNGAEREHVFEIEAKLGAMPYRFQVSAAAFGAMNWPMDHMGCGAIVYAGAGTRDHARVAIQTFSRGAQERTVYTHTGWREKDGRLVYLHAGGAIGEEGPVAGFDVELPESLSGFALPDPPVGEDLVVSVRKSMGLLKLGSAHVVVPLLASVYRAPLGACDSSPWLAGPSGTFKSETAALGEQHFGPAMDRPHLPGSWSSTDNALEALAFAAKDALLVIDDFAPLGSSVDLQRLHAKADRIIRAQGNGSGRQRLRGDGTFRGNRPPRGLIVSTGEDVLKGHSARARLFIIELAEGDIDPVELSRCQADAREGHYARAMAGFIRWLASEGRILRVQKEIADDVAALRQQAEASTMHRRTPDAIANLALGLRYFLEFARDVGAVNDADAQQLYQQGWSTLGTAAQKQAAHQAANEPAARFLELLGSAIAGENAHLSRVDGDAPAEPAGWGWRQKTVGSGAYARDDWEPRGERVGWVEGDDVYLDSDAAFKVAQQQAAGADGITVTPTTLKKRLDEKGVLIRDAKREELTVRKTLSGQVRRVLQLKPGTLFPIEPAKPAKPANTSSPGPENGDSLAGSLAGFLPPGPETRQKNPPGNPTGATKNAGVGGFGGFGGFSEGDTDPYETEELAARQEPGM
jgi:hypothetical protein